VRRLVLLLTAAATLGVGGWVALRAWRPNERPVTIPAGPDRVLVEVLNASGEDGLARRVTRALRARGFDVVYFGTAAFDTLQRTRMAVRRGDTLSAGRLRDALGVGLVVVDPNPRLLLDVSVLLGRDAAPLRFQP
jgi:hypothetical protein